MILECRPKIERDMNLKKRCWTGNLAATPANRRQYSSSAAAEKIIG